MLFALIFWVIVFMPLFVLVFIKKDLDVPCLIYTIVSILGIIVTFSLLRIFNYNTYRDILKCMYNLMRIDFSDVAIALPGVSADLAEHLCNITEKICLGVRWLVSKFCMVSLIVGFFGSLACLVASLDKTSSSEDSPLIIIIGFSVFLYAGIVFSILSLVFVHSEASLYTLFDSLFDKVGIGLTFIGKLLLALVGIAVIIGILVWIIKDKRMLYYGAKIRTLNLLSDLYVAIDEANLAVAKFSEAYSKDTSVQYIFFDAYETKTFCIKLHDQMENWYDEWFSDEKKATAYSYYNSFTLTFSFDIRRLINILEEISSNFSQSYQPNGANYNKALENCEETYANLKKKVKECNGHMKDYNETMSHFPYNLIEFSKLEKFQF